jgi:uncharacterized alkaline shock family protein YloU
MSVTEAADVDASVDLAKRPARIGQNELGRIEVEARAVEKIAALAAIEIPDVSGTAGRLLSRAVSGAMTSAVSGAVSTAMSGGTVRRRPSTRLPKVSAEVDGDLAFLEVELAVRWPAAVGQVTEAVRQHLFVQVRALLGLEVSEVNIQVVELPSDTVSARVA